MSEEVKVIKAVNSQKVKEEAKKKADKAALEANIDAQSRLAEILNDSPRIASLAGTEWEIRTLRQKVQWMIAEEVIKINKIEQGAGYGDIVKQFAMSMPSLIKVLTLAILNDREKIFRNGKESEGFSDLYQATYDTIAWDGNVQEYGELLFEILQMLDISFFMESHRILEVIRGMTMARKTTMNEAK